MNALMRRRCPQCQHMREMHSDNKVCSVACENARRKAAGIMQRAQAKAVAAIRAKRTTHLKGLGLLTEREQAIYLRGKRCGYESVRASTFEDGRRAGWAEALNERDDLRRGTRGRA